MLADTPEPPYYAVIFSSVLSDNNEGYQAMAEEMLALASEQPGFLGFESARNDIGLSVSYWQDLDAIKAWREHSYHIIAQNKGKNFWYEHYHVRIAKVERAYQTQKGRGVTTAI